MYKWLLNCESKLALYHPQSLNFDKKFENTIFEIKKAPNSTAIQYVMCIKSLPIYAYKI